MRLSTSQLFKQSIADILDKQSKLGEIQQQVASGKRISKPSDDPAAVARVLDIQSQIAMVQQYERNSNLAKTQLSMEESAINGVENNLQRVRELTIQASNDTLSPGDRKAIATEIRSRHSELLALANSQDANGEYLFAGFQNNNQPFTSNGGVPVYNGDQGQVFLQIGPDVQVASGDSGAAVFQFVDTGNGKYTVTDNASNTGTGVVGVTALDGSFTVDTYTLTFTQATASDPVTYQVSGAVSGVVASGTYSAGEAISFNGAAVTLDGNPANGDSFTVNPAGRQDLFTTLDKLATALESVDDSALGRARLHNEVNRQLNNIDRGFDNVLTLHAEIGARLNNIDSQSYLNEGFILQMQETQSDLEDMDLTEAISRLNLQTVALQAAQQSYIKTQGLSLFNYL